MMFFCFCSKEICSPDSSQPPASRSRQLHRSRYSPIKELFHFFLFHVDDDDAVYSDFVKFLFDCFTSFYLNNE